MIRFFSLCRKWWFLLLLPPALLVGGFVLFASNALHIAHSHDHHIPSCDGMVALTGGKDRISVSLSLLKYNPSLYLLISGVGPHVTLANLLHKNAPEFPAALKNHVTLGRQAQSTIGNAEETASWAHTRSMHRILVITAGYHMRRALMELHQTAPELVFIAWPVQPETLNHPLQKSVITLLSKEYIKLLGAVIRNILVSHHHYDGHHAPNNTF